MRAMHEYSEFSATIVQMIYVCLFALISAAATWSGRAPYVMAELTKTSAPQNAMCRLVQKTHYTTLSLNPIKSYSGMPMRSDVFPSNYSVKHVHCNIYTWY